MDLVGCSVLCPTSCNTLVAFQCRTIVTLQCGTIVPYRLGEPWGQLLYARLRSRLFTLILAYRNYETMCFLPSLIHKNARAILRAGTIAVTCLAFTCLFSSSVRGAITAEQRKQLKELNDGVREAGKLFNEGKFVEAAEKVTAIQSGLVKLLESKDADLQKETRRLFTTLQTAHGKLELEGAVLEPLPTWKELTEGNLIRDAAPDLSEN